MYRIAVGRFHPREREHSPIRLEFLAEFGELETRAPARCRMVAASAAGGEPGHRAERPSSRGAMHQTVFAPPAHGIPKNAASRSRIINGFLKDTMSRPSASASRSADRL